jgi:hypothetical protein
MDIVVEIRNRRERVISVNDARALELYRMALSLVEAKGRSVAVGLLAYTCLCVFAGLQNSFTLGTLWKAILLV